MAKKKNKVDHVRVYAIKKGWTKEMDLSPREYIKKLVATSMEKSRSLKACAGGLAAQGMFIGASLPKATTEAIKTHKKQEHQNNCDHEEVMSQGDGYVYGHCSKCFKELY